MRTILSIVLLFFCGITFAQTTITGTVVDDSGLPIPSANIIIVDASVGTVTDFDGKFTLTVDQNPPFTIQASSIGFEPNFTRSDVKQSNFRFYFKRRYFFR